MDLVFDEINEKINELASRAMRVLAFGYSRKELVDNKINEDVVLSPAIPDSIFNGFKIVI